MNHWYCSRCGRPMRSLTNPDRWLRLCTTCDPRPADVRRSYSLRWFDEHYPRDEARADALRHRQEKHGAMQ